jgi:hypothetical protein
MNQATRRPSGARITGVRAKLCQDAEAQARIMRDLGPELAAPICAEFPGGYLMPELSPLESAAEVPALLRSIWASDVNDSDRLVSRERYEHYVYSRIAKLPEFMKQPMQLWLDTTERSEADYPATIHGDATLANFMQLGDRTLAIDVSPRVHYGNPAQDISKLLLSFYGGLHCPVVAATVTARENFERAATEQIRDLEMGYDWRWDPDKGFLYLSENLLWDTWANTVRVLSREDNPRLYDFAAKSVFRL